MSKLLAKASSRIEHLLLSAFDEGSCYELNDPSRSLRLRPSSFPFCPLRFFLDLPDMQTKGKRIPASMAYYVRVGTVIHNTFQEAIASHETAAQFFVRDWKCPACGHIHSLSLAPSHCNKCSQPFHIHDAPAHLEHTIEDGNLVGHVDDTFCFSNKGDDYYVVMDYKSTSLNRMKSGAVPEPTHLQQLSAYAALLSKKVKVLGYVLIYIPRDNPRKLKAFAYTLTKQEVDTTLQKIALYEKQHKNALTVNTQSGLDALIEKRPCKTPEQLQAFCGKCRYGSYCTNSTNALDNLAASRLQRRIKQLKHHETS